MSSKRRNLLILAFVFGLIALSAVVILNQPTKLGLDLKGGVELVYEGTPTGQVEEVTGEDIERSINIIRERIDRLGVAEPEVSRLGNTQITVSLPDVTNAQRAIDQVGTTAQLYFYDWEPNLIGPEKVISGRPGQPPPRPVLKASEKRWEDVKRDPKKPQNAQLIAAGAYPTAYEAALLGSEQEPAKNCENCSVAKPRFYLFERKSPHELVAGPGAEPERPLRQPDRRKTAEERDRPRSSRRHHPGLRIPGRPRIRRAGPEHQAGLVRDQRRPGALGHRHHRPRTDPGEFSEPVVAFKFTDDGREAFHEVTRQIARRGESSSIGLLGGQNAEERSGHFAVVLDNEVETRPIVNYAENPDGIDGRTGAQISGGFHRHHRGAGPGDDPADRRPADQPEADQPDPGLGDARLPGARRRHQSGGHRPDPRGPLPAPLLPLPRPDRVDRARRLRGDLLRADQADPDHPDPAGHRRPGADDRGGGRLEHRHLRANKGGGARRADDVERDRRRLQTRDQRRSSTRTSSPCSPPSSSSSWRPRG